MEKDFTNVIYEMEATFFVSALHEKQPAPKSNREIMIRSQVLPLIFTCM